ncbi:MBL fold metallo-hydrolase [Rhodococcus artemisiae]|uniref:MBL fold metallo-hydrolase n=1 Tax=Rhodococcus artemisiae TaxID=714159 RepID=A0ABU7LBY5_9NOCA|nr:MBL fold metallo-hydrolase [Rhodococcus artemisiae]MEE2058422.1 MBL fold metallo-hydrolase [Rhodococcus artemisiae]
MSNPAEPQISSIAPGLWQIAMPFPSPLRHSFSYLLRTDNGFTAVDLGWDSNEGWAALTTALDRAGGSLDDLTGVVVTHGHPDHYGLAARVHQSTGAWIAIHPAEHPQIARTTADRQHRLDEIASWLDRVGVPAVKSTDLLADRDQLLLDMSSQWPDLELTDGAAIPGTDGQLIAVHTPGHTPGHMIFHDRGRDILFTGDHLLPRVSANISRRPTSADDPLGDYYASLSRLGPFSNATAAPGHEWTFTGIDGRVQDVEAHHLARLEEIQRAVAAGHRTVWDVANAVTWSRPFESLNPRGARSALGETLSHLVRLEREGRVECRDGDCLIWLPTGARADATFH